MYKAKIACPIGLLLQLLRIGILNRILVEAA
jgi:hypothetical protein